MKTKRLKLASAAIGGGALVSMGVLGSVTTDVTAAEERVEPGPITTSEMRTGDTTEDSAAPSKGPLTEATPEITTTPTSAEPG